MAGSAAPREIALSAAWNAGHLGADLMTIDGVSVQVVHRGTWSHGLGPDFRDAMILVDGRELRSGGVEIHLRTRGWIDHGHHLDPAYDDVVLHVVARHDGTPTQRLNGGTVPVVEIGAIDQIEVPPLATWDWSRVGGQTCASRLVNDNPRLVRDILATLGDTRLAARSARLEARLSHDPPGQILWESLLDGLGFSSNREPMRKLAGIVPIAALEERILATPRDERFTTACGLLLGAAGFLPLAPSEAHLGGLAPEAVSRIDAAWGEHGTAWHAESLAPSSWQRVRVRPANHPVARLVSAAGLVGTASDRGGLLAAILDIVVSESDPVAPFRSLCATGETNGMGIDRALDILASAVIPLALALASHWDDHALAEAAARQWEALPAPSPNAVTRRAARQIAGAAPLGRIGARGAQGLIHLDTTLCQPRRCFECPVAAAELSVKDR